LLGRIVNGADSDNTLYHQAEGPGLQSLAEGFRHLGYKDDHELNAAEWIVYDAFYAYAKEMVKRGKAAIDRKPIGAARRCGRICFNRQKIKLSVVFAGSPSASNR
jgi:hypothetical protein